MNWDQSLLQKLLTYQENEITEYHIYKALAQTIASEDNKEILMEIAEDELGHYKDWKEYTQQDVKPNQIKIWFYYWISRLFGITFGIKLMERGEEDAQENYSRLKGDIEGVDSIIEDENDHEDELLKLLDEKHLRYVGSIVLGLNDALVELTGALAGLTLALQSTPLIALSGLITGIAAALSMGASEYLSTKEEDTEQQPLLASLYTGGTYLITVIILILPYLIFANYYFCLALTLFFAVLIIGVFNYYISVVRDEQFKGRFFEMAGVSLGVAFLSFGIGYFIRTFMGVEV